MLSVFLFGTDILLEHVEHMTRLEGEKKEKKCSGLSKILLLAIALGQRGPANSFHNVKATVIFLQCSLLSNSPFPPY